MTKPTKAHAHAYGQLSLPEKQALNRERMREPSVSCPSCDTQTTASDLLSHMDSRCTGPREPGPGSKWVSWRDAKAMGVPNGTMSFWARTGQVRFLGERQDRRYLLRDLAMKIAQRRGFRRR